jgi:CRISPR type IV-associated protein Csf2
MSSTEYHIDTLLTLISPLHVTVPGNSYWNPETSQWQSTNNNGAWPTARTSSMPLATTAPVNGDETEGGKKPSRYEIAFYPGNSFRGGFRRCAAEIVFEILQSLGETIPFDLYHVMMCGSAASSPEKAATVAESAAAFKNPFAALVGGGPKFIHSQFLAGNFFPVTRDTLAAHMVPAQFSEYCVSSSWITDVLTNVKVDDILRGTGRVPTIVKDIDAEIIKWVKALQDSKDSRDAKDEATKKVGLATIYGKEVIIPGVRLHASHVLESAFNGEAILGLTALALAKFANKQRIGGGAREGFGRFVMQCTARNGTGGSFELVRFADGVYSANVLNERVASAVSAWEKYATTLTAAQLMKDFMLK